MKKPYLLISFVLFTLMLALIFYVRSLYIVSAVEAVTFFEPSARMQRLFLDNGSLPAAKKSDGHIRVVYFWQKACVCDEWVKPHFLLLAEAYLNRYSDIQFYVASVKGEPVAGGLQSIEVLPHVLLDIVQPDVEATPSVAIWDKQGELVYYGPHNIGYTCNDDSSLIKKMLDGLLGGQVMSALSVVGDGCFCRAH